MCGLCRYNLDPEGHRSDDELWEALDIVNMKETIKYMSGQLGLLSAVAYSIVRIKNRNLFFQYRNDRCWIDAVTITSNKWSK